MHAVGIRARPLAAAAFLGLLAPGSFASGPAAAGVEDEPGSPAAQARPNLLVLYTDDQRFDSLSSTGNPWIETPHLDRLAAEGAVFENALVTVSLCCPSRATFLTGKYAHSLGVLSNSPEEGVLEGQRLFPAILREHGYETAFIGKWHLPNPGAAPVEGFDHWVSFEGQGFYERVSLNVDGESERESGHSAEILTDRAVRWLEAEHRGPWLLILSLKNCHPPYRPPKQFLGQLEKVDLSLPGDLEAEDEDLPERVRRFQERHDDLLPNEEVVLLDYRRYLELVLSVDECMGRLEDTLEALGEMDRTLILFTSDNGYLWGEHGTLYKSMTWEPSLHVPLLVRYPPRIPAGVRLDEPVLNLDLAPTLLDAAGLPPDPGMEGRSFLPLLTGDSTAWRERTFHHAPFRRSGGEAPKEIALRTRRYKYVVMRAGKDSEELLFDLREDPGELHDLSRDPAHAEILQDLRSAIRTEALALGVPGSWLEEP
jgi:N-acetylglucosamine-6-sulfatase